MRKLGKCIVSGIVVFSIPTIMSAQSSVGIGTNSPNPNSVLHLETTGGNQGLLLPKLTTAQMQASPFLQSLGMAEKGLMVYDTDRDQMFGWDGTKWKSSANFSLPYIDSVENGPNQTNLFRIINKGSTGNAVGIMYLENRDPDNGFAPLLITTNSKMQGAVDLVISNQQNTNDGIGVSYRGLGSAGAFMVNNTASTVAALKSTTNGVAGSVAIRGEATNNGTGIAAFSNGNAFLSPAIYAEQSGTGDAAGVFKLTNAGNNTSAVFGESLGAGPTLFSIQKGTGRAGQFQINNTTNTEVALRGFTDGLGRAGFFTINNAANGSAAIHTTTNGTGNAGFFEVDNAASTVAALNASTNGIAGSVAVRGIATNSGTGIAAYSNGNAFISPALYAEQSGTGDAAGVFKLTNTSNPYNAVFGETVGSGSTFFAWQKGTGRAGQFQISNVSNTEAALRGFTDGLGRAGFFTINNTANNADAIYTTTNANGGTAIGAANSGNGNAIAIWDGGLRLSTSIINSNGNISNRSAAYEITAGSTFTINFPLNNGETFFFYNNTAGAATVNGISIPANSGKTFIVLSNTLRGM